MTTQNTNPPSLSIVQNIIDYIESHLLENITTVIVAKQFLLSEVTLSVLFKAVCGITVAEYIRNRRLTLAASELSSSNLPILDLAYKYGYDTPEAFTKAFSRFHGFPPSLIRRGFPVCKRFDPLKIEVAISGGWQTKGLQETGYVSGTLHPDNSNPSPFPDTLGTCSTEHLSTLPRFPYPINTSHMQYTREWNTLYTLTKQLSKNQILFKLDGKTLIFAHGLEFPLDKICLTFKWKEEQIVKDFFESNTATKCTKEGFKYFDVLYDGMTIRCMFYGDCPGDDTDDFLYRNTDLVQIDDLLVPVQTLEFYYGNASKDTTHYQIVEEWLKEHERL